MLLGEPACHPCRQRQRLRLRLLQPPLLLVLKLGLPQLVLMQVPV